MTTVLVVRRNGRTVMGGDGQVTLGSSVVKHGARKIRRLYHDSVLVGFAGSAADGLALMERLESKLEEFRGSLVRACVELAKEWRTDRYLRRLEAFLLVADREHIFLLSGGGDLLEPDEPIMAIGSGGDVARASAMALYRHTSLSAEEIVLESLKIASQVCIYTNDRFVIESL
ncbi:20S proteasome A and B subunits [Thermocrinis albus DSM 14484]|uniref:ATP-dependent protease subunit HslV n=1 Tax=Thermocrinis albus (strain DSM 14484 / JCM 11386 / HI 11/12) TaxID=638303 RepID=D3SPK3_THEAH|nr:ATP-dependent protease subunit HslV [Thermocrinis albus]ADC89090.1 20S proteasome A and B subunits [Thermocrinis albus DSM 14484]